MGGTPQNARGALEFAASADPRKDFADRMSAAGVSESPSARGGAAAAAGMMRPRPHTALPHCLGECVPFQKFKPNAMGGNGWNPFSLLFLPARGVAGAFRKFWWGRTPKGGH